MTDLETKITGSAKLTNIFGRWPSFHDAEVLELNFWRGNVQPDEGMYDFPVLMLKIHLWELTNEVDPKGYLVLRHHTLANLKFYDVEDFQMEGFNHQNAMMELHLSIAERSQGASPYFAVTLVPAFGMGAAFKCLRIEVVDAVLCSDEGKAIPESP